MLSEIICDIKSERDRILVRAQGGKLFLELADPKRLGRASEILRGGGVHLTLDSPEDIRGTCSPSSGGEPYQVSFKVRGTRVRGASCTCQDSGNSSCKHVLALCALWLLYQKKLWKKLNDVLILLEPDDNQTGTI